MDAFKKFLDKAFDENRGGSGYYDWRSLKYFLFEYEQFLQEEKKEDICKLDWSIFSQTNSDFKNIEHILPQDDTEWKKQEWYKIKKKDKFLLTNSIGNLVALSIPKNSSLSNNTFEIKKNGKPSDKQPIGYKYGSYSEIEITEHKIWGYEEIKSRGLKLLDFMERRWSIKKYNKDFDFWSGIENKEDLLFLPK